jgi:hypothetical protein
MAFDKLSVFPLKVKELHDHGRLTYMQALEVLTQYYETALQHAKFSGQRCECRKIMFEISKPFCEGYFKTTDPLITPKKSKK